MGRSLSEQPITPFMTSNPFTLIVAFCPGLCILLLKRSSKPPKKVCKAWFVLDSASCQSYPPIGVVAQAEYQVPGLLLFPGIRPKWYSELAGCRQKTSFSSFRHEAPHRALLSCGPPARMTKGHWSGVDPNPVRSSHRRYSPSSYLPQCCCPYSGRPTWADLSSL